ncbi:DUF4625 domain-containing protein [Prevotella sp. MA2016]|uniref:DUF4625 domain-containing protein n=1 Tax=Prevotella sp. MA2016 TaxID=1408310 RepID=UPI00048D8C61|nr:DUF4625 domain-containing protein [Prevotella sp. MA2016]
MKKSFSSIIILLCALSACSSSDADDARDMNQPIISEEGIIANPVECQQYHPGDVIPVQYVFTDDVELGQYNIEIHNNFDHHTHSGSAVDCELDMKKEAGDKAWIFNQDFTIPAGQRTYTTHIDIPIPSDAETGDYHFMIRLTDRAGWQQLKAIAIKIK